MLLVLLLLAPSAIADKVAERHAISIITKRPALTVTDGTKASEHAMTRIHFWVGKDGAVEAVEQVCGERALFDEIVDATLEFEFQPRESGAFVTDINFERSGRRVLLQLEMPEAERHASSDCAQ